MEEGLELDLEVGIDEDRDINVDEGFDLGDDGEDGLMAGGEDAIELDGNVGGNGNVDVALADADDGETVDVHELRARSSRAGQGPEGRRTWPT